MKDLLARRAEGAWLITGAASGFGRELACQLARLGAPLVLWDRNAPGLDETVAKLDASPRDAVHADVVDVTDASAVQAAAERARTNGPIAHIVCCAGILRVGRFEEVPLAEYRRMMDVNYLGSVHVAHTLLSDLRVCGSRRRPATLMLVASVAGLRGFPELAGYSASKFALAGLAQALGDEVHGSGIDVRLLCPPPGDTPMVQSLEHTPPVYKLSRLYTAEEVASAALAALRRGPSRGRASQVVLVDLGSRALDMLNRGAPSLLDRVVRTAARRQ